MDAIWSSANKAARPFTLCRRPPLPVQSTAIWKLTRPKGSENSANEPRNGLIVPSGFSEPSRFDTTEIIKLGCLSRRSGDNQLGSVVFRMNVTRSSANKAVRLPQIWARIQGSKTFVSLNSSLRVKRKKKKRFVRKHIQCCGPLGAEDGPLPCFTSGEVTHDKKTSKCHLPRVVYH